MNQTRGLNRCSKLPDDGDPWAPNNLLKPGAKEKKKKHNNNRIPVGQATDKKLWPKPTKMKSFMSGSSYRRTIKEVSIVINHNWVKN